MASRRASRGKAPEVLSAAYLERAGGKSELLRRLVDVTERLDALPEDVDAAGHPGLLSLSAALVSPAILDHKDKEVRLRAVLAACEIFYIYAPEPPWEEGEILTIFRQLIRQLGNLHATSPESGHFESYFRILEQLSEVKIGVVLVDLIRTERGSDEGESALETLCELIRTLLNCVHVDHPPEVAAHAELAVSACIEEFEGNIPIPVLEEVLTCVGGGPVVWAPNPAFAAVKKKSGKKGKDDLPPQQIQQTNTSYLLAAKVLRRTEDKISSPIASLLNALLTGDPNVTGRTSLSTVDAEAAALLTPKGSGKKKRKGSGGKDEKEESPSLAAHLTGKDANAGANVYSISYELHRIAPQILTTVIGTVSTELVNEDLAKRWQATRLLGRLFCARSSDIAARFGPCFNMWLRRSYDPEAKVRETMVKLLVNFLTTQHQETDLCADVNEALATIIVKDPTLDIRLLGIHQVCDLAHNAAAGGGDSAEATREAEAGTLSSGKRKHPISVVSADLLLAVGSRVSSKNKTEHKDAITGLAQVYYKHYLRRKVRFVQEGGDDVAIDEILDVLKESKGNGKGKSADDEKFAWIPQMVFKCVSYSDSTDSEMRNRVFQIVDDILLGTTKSKDSGSGIILTPTSRAVGLAMIVASVKEKESAFKWMCTLFSQRSRLQMALGAYLDARSKAKECDAGSAEAFAADSDAVEKLEKVAALSAPVADGKSSPGAADLEAILKKVHRAKDKHVFRILFTICSPSHSPSARLRAFDELPKRTKGLGSDAQTWVKCLARRCAMGAFLNAENIEHCIILSQEAFEAGDCGVAAGFLECVKVATSIFPSLGSTEEGFKNLVEFFDAARTTSMTSGMKRDMEKHGVVTMLSEILARSGTGATAASRPSSGGKKDDDMDFEEDEEGNSSYGTLREQLLRLCTRDGTPEQARNSVRAISSMIGPASPSKSGASDLALRVSKEKKEFEPLLKALVNPSRLSVPDDDTSTKTKGRIVSILSAIAAIAECAPYAFNATRDGKRTGWGQKALDFCLDTVLLGKNARLNTSTMDDESSDDDGEETSPAKKSRSKGKSSSVSVHCQMLCGAIEVLVAHIRSTIVKGKSGPKMTMPSSDHIAQVFSTLVKILEDGGVPPSSIDGRYCSTAKDKAELRRIASVNLLRLCDASLKLEVKWLSQRMWQIMSSALLDEDKGVRSAFMEELSCMFTATGSFRHGGQQLAPSLRFVSLVTLCADGDHGAHSEANAGAANVGQKRSTAAKFAATQCIKLMRATCQAAASQCRSMGRAAEKNFETRLKQKLMPEYIVPYALHLLAFRHETASAAGTLAGENDDKDSDVSSEGEEEAGVSGDVLHSQEASQKMLKKRLKWLFDPLVQSLGTSADNISFLLRMVELIGKHPPINVLSATANDESSLEMGLGEDEDAGKGDIVDEREAEARMKIITQFAREVLLSYVKKDVNLSTYPGSIQLPGDLYRGRTSMSPPPPAYESDESEEAPRKKKPKKSISHYVKKRNSDEMSEKSAQDDASDEKSGASDERSPDKSAGDSPPASPAASPPASSDNEEDFDKEFGDFSPIAKADDSPAPIAASAGKKKRSSVKETKSGSSKGVKSKASSRKRRSSDIDIFDEFPSPATDGTNSSSVADKRASSKKRRSTTTPRASASGRKAKATPVSVPVKTVMVNVTNSAGSEGSAAVASQKKKGAPKKKTKVTAASSRKDDDLDFSDSPVKPKAKGGRRKKSSAAAKDAPARKARAPSKAKISIGKASGKKAAVAVGKGGTAGGKKAASRRAKSTPVEEPSPSTTSEASSRPARRSGRRGVRA